MAGPSVTAQGQTLMTGAEQNVAGDMAGSKYLQFSVDTTPLLAGDTLEVRFYKKVNSAGVLSRFQVERYTDADNTEPLSPVKDSGPFWIANTARLTIKQTTGTYRTISWEVLES